MKIIAIPLLAALLFYLPASSPALDRAERPEIEKGDSWTYVRTVLPTETKTRYTLVVRQLTADTVEVGVGSNSRSLFTRDWALAERKQRDEVTWRGEPALPLMQFPIEVGKQWNGNLTGTYNDGYVQYWRGRGWVDKIEKVAVQAGTFDAYLVHYDGYYNARYPGMTVRWFESIWYAPQVGRWVKREWTWSTGYPGVGSFQETQRDELVSFTRGGKPLG